MMTSTEINRKRERSSNFTINEKVLLINIIEKYKMVIENKKTDQITCQEKKDAWEKILIEFNTMATNCNRSVECLKIFYDNQKKNIRKIIANEKKDIYQTGGGTPSTIKKEAFHDVLLSIMNTKTVVGLNNKYDSDGILGVSTLSQANSNLASTSNEVLSEEVEIMEEENMEFNNNEPNTYLRTETCTWKKYKPENLIKPVSGVLRTNNKSNKVNDKTVSRRRPMTTVKALTTSEISEKYNKLLDKRLEIAEYQKQLLLQNLEHARNEHELKCKLLKSQIDNIECKNQQC